MQIQPRGDKPQKTAPKCHFKNNPTTSKTMGLSKNKILKDKGAIEIYHEVDKADRVDNKSVEIIKTLIHRSTQYSLKVTISDSTQVS